MEGRQTIGNEQDISLLLKTVGNLGVGMVVPDWGVNFFGKLPAQQEFRSQFLMIKSEYCPLRFT